MHLLLDVERRNVHNQITQVLLVLATPYKLWIEIHITRITNLLYVLLAPLHHRLIFGGRDVLALAIVVTKCFNDLAWFLSHVNSLALPADQMPACLPRLVYALPS